MQVVRSAITAPREDRRPVLRGRPKIDGTVVAAGAARRPGTCRFHRPCSVRGPPVRRCRGARQSPAACIKAGRAAGEESIDTAVADQAFDHRRQAFDIELPCLSVAVMSSGSEGAEEISRHQGDRVSGRCRSRSTAGRAGAFLCEQGERRQTDAASDKAAGAISAGSRTPGRAGRRC